MKNDPISKAVAETVFEALAAIREAAEHGDAVLSESLMEMTTDAHEALAEEMGVAA